MAPSLGVYSSRVARQGAEPGFADGFAVSWLSFGVK